MQIKEYLRENRLITDGAMGTYYEEKYGAGEIAELANIEYPQRVTDIHLEYLRSGAQLIRTNSFALNTMLIEDMEELEELVKASYQNAKTAVDIYRAEDSEREVYIAADLGPIYPDETPILGEYDEEKDVLQEYCHISDIFLECGADVFVFETMSDFSYVRQVTEYIKKKAPDTFILVQFAFDKSGLTKAGLSVQNMLTRSQLINTVDAYGFNCGITAAHLENMLSDVIISGEKFVSALPNGSYPYELRGKIVYSNSAKYFSKRLARIAKKGIDIIGGCCGTTPEYIRQLSEVIADIGPKQKRDNVEVNVEKAQDVALSEKSAFIDKLSNGKKVFVVELDPPFGLDTSKVMAGAEQLKSLDVDLITLADSPMARTRMDPLQLAAKVQRESGISVMPHLCCRDRNTIAMRSGILGAYMNEIRNFLFITGDPVSRDSRDRIKSVYDFNSIKLMDYVREMNSDVFADEPVVYFGALNYHGVNVDAIAKRMKLKMENGCSGFLTQPVYSDEDIERIKELKEMTGAKIMCGIMPLVSYKNAMFIKNEMPGIKVTDEIVAKYHEDMTREEAEEVAVEVSLDIAEKLYPYADGFYMMTPFNRAELVGRIIDKIKSNI